MLRQLLRQWWLNRVNSGVNEKQKWKATEPFVGEATPLPLFRRCVKKALAGSQSQRNREAIESRSCNPFSNPPNPRVQCF